MTAQSPGLPLYTAAETRALDRAAMDAGVPGMVLMERAGEAAVAALWQRWPDWPARRIVVLAGGGNNGGDGYVIARRLLEAGARVVVLAAADPGGLTGDAADAATRWRQAGGETRTDAAAFRAVDCDLAVDALLGTGLASEVRAPYRGLLEAVAAAGVPVLAVDIPSGLAADTGRVLGAAAPAEVTVTFVGRKRGLFTGDGPGVAGKVVFDDLGIPQPVAQAHPPQGHLLAPAAVALPPRPVDSHKGDFGRVVAAGGAAGMAGALALAGWAALRAGAGWVVACAEPGERPSVAGFQPELITAAWDAGGGLPPELKAGAHALAVGPGLGRTEAARRLLADALAQPVPVVVDADGLNLLAEQAELAQRLRDREAPTVLTPHPGEAGRLLGDDVASVQADRFAAACRIAADYRAVCCLKGAGTVIARPAGDYAVNPTGNPGMAVGGQGDVLTGIVAARLAQGDPPEVAAQRAVWAHGAAADRVAAERGPFGFTPTECADALPAVWAALSADTRPLE
jgi:NAD(P)H-hydrate epimerase